MFFKNKKKILGWELRLWIWWRWIHGLTKTEMVNNITVTVAVEERSGLLSDSLPLYLCDVSESHM